MAQEDGTTGTPNKAPKYEETERQGMRAFLQRGEVRLSTMHRIAGVFLNGAGLLILVPLISRDALSVGMAFLLEGAINGQFITYWAFLAAFVIALSLPLYGLYLLIQDIIQFYFSPYHYGAKDTDFFPRFVLSGIAFSPDESESAKEAVLSTEEEGEPSSLLHLVVPRRLADRDYFKRVNRAAEGHLIHESRLKRLSNSQLRDPDGVGHLYTAFGLTGTVDRELSEETAKMEVSLVCTLALFAEG